MTKYVYYYNGVDYPPDRALSEAKNTIWDSKLLEETDKIVYIRSNENRLEVLERNKNGME